MTKNLKNKTAKEGTTMSTYNVYCDESCHLENDASNVMTLGGIYCKKDIIKEINKDIIEIKKKFNIPKNTELKWTKISPAKLDLYKALVNYFFENENLHFRCSIIHKENLNYEEFSQTHDDWYYKMYFSMLKVIFAPSNIYNIFLDIKDTNSYEKTQKLHEVIANQRYDFNREMIQKVQNIRSHEVQIMQIVDILTGALAFRNRNFAQDTYKSVAKEEIVNLIKERTGYSLERNTYLSENKFNLFVWQGRS